MTTSKQVKHVPNPTGKGGFADRPEDRSNGRWKPEGSISYNYNKLIRMSAKELDDFEPETVAQQIALARVKSAKDQKYGLPDAKELADRTEGKPAQAIDMTSNGETIQPVMVEFINADDSNTD